VGQPLTLHFVAHGPSVDPSTAFRHGMAFFLRMSRTFSASPSLLTPRKAKGLSFRRSTSALFSGIAARHGPHQKPQKSTTSTFPR